MTKYVYDFSEGNKDMKDLLGGKGANLAEMSNLGLPVPPGFTIPTEVVSTTDVHVIETAAADAFAAVGQECHRRVQRKRVKRDLFGIRAPHGRLVGPRGAHPRLGHPG